MAVAGGGGAAPVAGFFLRHDCSGCGGVEEFVGLLARSRRRRRRGSASLDSGWILDGWTGS